MLSTRTRLPFILLFLLLLPTTLVQSSDDSSIVTQVECEGNITLITTKTKFIFEGRNDLMKALERNALALAFLEIYNKITADLCDSYFRRLESLDFISMTNGLNETLTYLDDDLLAVLDNGPPPPQEGQPGGGPPEEGPPGEGPPEDGPPGEGPPAMPGGNATEGEIPLPLPEELPENPPDAPPELPPTPPGPPPGPFGRLLRLLQGPETRTTTSVNSTTTNYVEGVEVTYEVTGTCRECPVSRSGNFALYDEGFRRRLLQYLQEHSLSLSTTSLQQRQLQTPPFPPPPSGDQNGDGQSAPAPEDGPRGDAPPENGPPGEGPPAMLGPGNYSDCTCALGLEPEMPASPSALRLLEFLNEKIAMLQAQEGLFQKMRLVDLIQLGDDEYDDDANVDGLDTEMIEKKEAGVVASSKEGVDSHGAIVDDNQYSVAAALVSSGGVSWRDLLGAFELCAGLVSVASLLLF